MKVHSLGDAEIEKALISPTSVFDEPSEVVESRALNRLIKIEILRRWELDARALQRATDENMTGGEAPPLDAVNAALAILDPQDESLSDLEKAPAKL
jgi:hypothetical protein